MKKVYFNLFASLLIILSNCGKSDNNIEITTGLKGNIKYGIGGDCMPIIDQSTRVCNDFDRDLYFIVKSDLENLGNGNFDELKAKNIKKIIKNGDLTIELPIDTFLVMPSDVYLFADYNTIITEQEVESEKDFKFWKCASYWI